MLGNNSGTYIQKDKSQIFDLQILSSYLCTQTRGRTGMEVNPLVFETSASTDSAIWATFSVNCGAKVALFSKSAIAFLKKEEKNEKTCRKGFFFMKYNVH